MRRAVDSFYVFDTLFNMSAIQTSTAKVLGHIRSRFGTLSSFSLLFKALNLLLLTPVAAGCLRLFVGRWGRVSVGNFEIAVFLLSPTGLVAILVVGGLLLTTLYLELAGLVWLLAHRRSSWWQGLTDTVGRGARLFILGVRQLVVLLLLAVPFLAGIGVVYGLFWRGRDLNGLIVLKPPEFWIGVGLAGALAVAYAVLVAWLLLRWGLALPAILFEPVSVSEALRLSTQRTRGRLVSLAGTIAVWLVLQVLLSAAGLGLLRLLSRWVLDHVGHSAGMAIPVTAGLLIAHTLVAVGLGIVGSAVLAALLLAHYRQTVGPGVLPESEPDPPSDRRALRAGWILVGAIVGLVVLIGFVSERLLNTVRLHERLEISAHRGGAVHAPENTIAAIREAIVAGADWAEIDVQRTADDALVVMHDTDLARVGGGNRRVADVTLAEIRTLDIGKLFAPKFAGERIPTLDEVLTTVGDQIPLTIELKAHGKADETGLTERVVEAIRRAGMVDRCRLCSQSYESMQLARRLEPRLRVGFIAARALGDLSQLDVDFLMVHTDLATRALVERAGLRGLEVHAWTVNDRDWVARLLDRGVTNVITDDPILLRARLEEIRRLSPVERLLLRARGALAD